MNNLIWKTACSTQTTPDHRYAFYMMFRDKKSMSDANWVYDNCKRKN